jgi:hypothetical protein
VEGGENENSKATLQSKIMLADSFKIGLNATGKKHNFTDHQGFIIL